MLECGKSIAVNDTEKPCQPQGAGDGFGVLHVSPGLRRQHAAAPNGTHIECQSSHKGRIITTTIDLVEKYLPPDVLD